MCLGIPMQVIAVDGLTARCEARGVERTVSLMLLQPDPVEPGDVLLVHRGEATATMTREQAELSWALLDELLAAEAIASQGDR